MNCTTLWRRIIPAIGGRWIPYTAAQVAARRAAQMVAVVVCTVTPTPAMGPPVTPPLPPIYIGPPPLLVPRVVAYQPPPIPTPEPAGALVLVPGLLALLGVRAKKGGRGACGSLNPAIPAGWTAGWGRVTDDA